MRRPGDVGLGPTCPDRPQQDVGCILQDTRHQRDSRALCFSNSESSVPTSYLEMALRDFARARRSPIRQRPSRLSRSFALPEAWSTNGGRARLAWCKDGVDRMEKSTAKERFCCAHATFLSPPCEGGVGGVGQTASASPGVGRRSSASPGVGRRSSASPVCPSFANNDVRKRHALKPARPRTCRRTRRSFAPSTAPSCNRSSSAHPPYPPFTRGGKKTARAEFSQ
jgi:hypothetical protein